MSYNLNLNSNPNSSSGYTTPTASPTKASSSTHTPEKTQNAKKRSLLFAELDTIQKENSGDFKNRRISRRPTEVSPIKYTFVGDKVKYYIEWRNVQYFTQVINSGADAKSAQSQHHQVHRLLGTELVVKIYDKIKSDRDRNHIKAMDRDSYNYLSGKLNDFPIANLRLGTMHTNPVEDNMLIMEFVEHDQGFEYSWNENSRYEDLPQNQKEMVDSLCQIFAWAKQNNINLCDFIPRNAMYSNHQFVLIDWFKPSDVELSFYMEKWAHGSEDILKRFEDAVSKH